MTSPPEPHNKTLIVIILLFFVSFNAFSQAITENSNHFTELKDYINKRYRLDDLFVNGHLYRPNNSNANGSPYFLNDKLWKKSNLFIKGRLFTDQDIMYNIETDDLIAKIQFPDGRIQNIILDEKYIDSLYIENHFFVNISCLTNGTLPGLYQQVYSGKIKVLVKHHTNYKPIITYSTPNGFYEKPSTTLYILYNQELIRIANKKALLDFFYEHKKVISKFMRNNNIRLKTANRYSLFNLFKFCDELTNS